MTNATQTETRTREFEDGQEAYSYARCFGGTVEMVTPPGYPHFYRVTIK